MPYPTGRPNSTTPRWPGKGSTEGERIRFWRENVMQLTEAALGERLGVSRSLVRRMERGRTAAKKKMKDADYRWFRLACAALAKKIRPAWGKPRR